MLSREGDVGAWVLLCGAWVLLCGAWVLLCRPNTCFGSYDHLQVDRLTTKIVSSYTLACNLCMVDGI